MSEDFSGLEADCDRYRLMVLVKRAGREAGFTSRMIQLLDHYVAFTRECDWEEGSRPIVYQSLSRTALDLGVSERQIQKLELALFKTGAITWRDSGNHRRYGQRDPATGRLLFAFGVDLTPLAYLKEKLEQKLHEKQLYDQAWLETKRQISFYRRQVRSAMLEQELVVGGLHGDWLAVAGRYEAIAYQIRTHISLEELRQLLSKHQTLHAEVCRLVPEGDCGRTQQETRKSSSISEPAFAHYNYTTQLPTDKSVQEDSPADVCFQKSVAEPSEPPNLALASGMQHVTLRQVLQAASDRFRDHLPATSRPLNWSDIVDAAASLRSELEVSQASWIEACSTLGRCGAAVCMVLTDQATSRANAPVTCPPAYFRGMINKAKSGELKLHNSIFGLLERGDRRAAS